MSRLVITNNLTLDGVLRLVDSVTTTTGVVIGTFEADS
jgi:hypothetical protein